MVHHSRYNKWIMNMKWSFQGLKNMIYRKSQRNAFPRYWLQLVSNEQLGSQKMQQFFSVQKNQNACILSIIYFSTVNINYRFKCIFTIDDISILFIKIDRQISLLLLVTIQLCVLLQICFDRKCSIFSIVRQYYFLCGLIKTTLFY